MFIGRVEEIEELRKAFDSPSFEFIVVSGRRRIGKTTLISKACEGYRTVFHLSVITTEAKSLADLAKSTALSLNEGDGISFTSFEAYLDYLALKAKDESLVLVLDEFPFLAQSIPEAIGVLQRCIDLKFKSTHLKLVLCGSSVSFMEHQVLGQKSPLYGRRTVQIRLKAFGLKQTKQLFGGSDEDTVIVQAITGGIPLYISYFDPQLAMKANIRNLFLRTGGLLFNEPMTIMNMEMGDPRAAFNLLEIIGNGVNKVSELSDKSGLSAPNVSYHLAMLQELGLIDKKLPFSETNRKKSIWFISDGLFAFYFSCIYPFRSLIERGIIGGIEEMLKESLPRFAGRQFERMCADYLLCSSGLIATAIGSWWGWDPRTRREEEIDIVAKGLDGEMAFAECKFTDDKVGTEVYDTLLERSKNLPSTKARKYWLFSRTGFEAGLVERAGKEPGLTLIELRQLVNQP